MCSGGVILNTVNHNPKVLLRQPNTVLSRLYAELNNLVSSSLGAC